VKLRNQKLLKKCLVSLW